VFWILVLGLGCRTDVTYEGTLVGNAGSTKGKLTSTSGYTCDAPQIPISNIQLFNIQGDELYVDMNPTSDLLVEGMEIPLVDASSVYLEMGNWELVCTVGAEENIFAFVSPTLDLALSGNGLTENMLIALGDEDWLLSPNPQEALEQNSTLWNDGNANGDIDSSDSLLAQSTFVEEDDDNEDEHSDTGDDSHSEESDNDEEDTAE